jgi:hypothetical protein
MLDTQELRQLEAGYREDALNLAKLMPVLAWYHHTLHLALAEVDRLQGLLTDRTIANGKSVGYVTQEQYH